MPGQQPRRQNSPRAGDAVATHLRVERERGSPALWRDNLADAKLLGFRRNQLNVLHRACELLDRRVVDGRMLEAEHTGRSALWPARWIRESRGRGPERAEVQRWRAGDLQRLTSRIPLRRGPVGGWGGRGRSLVDPGRQRCKSVRLGCSCAWSDDRGGRVAPLDASAGSRCAHAHAGRAGDVARVVVGVRLAAWLVWKLEVHRRHKGLAWASGPRHGGGADNRATTTTGRGRRARQEGGPRRCEGLSTCAGVLQDDAAVAVSCGVGFAVAAARKKDAPQARRDRAHKRSEKSDGDDDSPRSGGDTPC